MFVNFINPRYPGEDTAAGTCHFRLLKNSPDVCQIRVDFVDTVTKYLLLNFWDEIFFEVLPIRTITQYIMSVNKKNYLFMNPLQVLS